MTKVLVFDDDEALRDEIADKVPKDLGLSVVPLEAPVFLDACRALADRERTWRDQGDHVHNDAAHVFDGADVVLLDFNLAGLLMEGKGLPATTGAEIAARLRCFSKTGVIVNLNRWGNEPEFRLEMRWPAETYADLDIAAAEVNCSSVWEGRAGRGEFAPTYRRPVLPLLRQLALREAEAVASWDVPIREFFGFRDDEWDSLPRAARALIGRKDPGGVTLARYVQESGLGLRLGDITAANKDKRLPNAARLVASRLGAWLEVSVGLLEDCLSSIGTMARLLPMTLAPADGDWNRLVRDEGAPELVRLDGYRLSRRAWSTRPLWWWFRVQRDNTFPENVEPWAVDPNPLVFASDSGTFIARSAGRLFRADLELNSDRFVGQVDGVSYRPDDYLMRA